MDGLVPFYHPHKGRPGHSFRPGRRLHPVSTAPTQRSKIIEHIQENRYMQYVCNVPDQNLRTFMNPSTLCRFRKRLGKEGILHIEDQVFNHLKRARSSTPK